ncbi:MAG TPA: alpha/beta hydrolase [Acetobacteraceae bacterium]|nr:alpha/beta hydrolase [Acetobacteraceae bacterium]
MPLDPHVGRFLRALSAAGPAAAASPSAIDQRRAAFRGLLAFAETGARVARSDDGVLPGSAGPLRFRLYTPLTGGGGRLPGLVFFHGGGFVAGDLDAYDPLCRALCSETGCRVIAVDYRLAPEHRFPAAVQDAYAATVWVARHAEALGLDPERIGIAGDSAGGTLAAAICQLVGTTREARLALQLLLCPILDWAEETPSRRAFATGCLADRDMMQRDMACYLSPGTPTWHRHVSPLRATGLQGQPPAYIHTAEFDPLRDEGEAYAERLRAAGVPVRHTRHDGMVHLFYGLGAVVPYARHALARIGGEIGAALTATNQMPRGMAMTHATAGEDRHAKAASL